MKKVLPDFFITKLDTVGFQRHSHTSPTVIPKYGFAFLTAGKILVRAGGEQFLIKSGEFMLMPPDTPFEIEYFDNSIGFDGGFAAYILKDASYGILHAGQPRQQSFLPKDVDFVNELFSRIHAASQSEPQNMAVILSCLDLVFSLLRVEGGTAASLLAGQFLNAVFDRNRMPGSVSSYARELHVRPEKLTKAVKRYTERTAVDWIEIARLNYAKQLLRNSDMPIIEVAAAVGIDDQSYFARFFRKKEGISPSKFRLNNKTKKS